ncbi:MAG: hypothetical protein ACI8YQ_003981 [Polaribacter sp.]|jgi:hypothetical protein
MTQKKGAGLRIKTEVLIVFVFFLCFIIWAISKCSAKKQEYVEPTTEESAATETERADSIALAETTSSERPTAASSAQTITADDNSPAPVIKTVFATKLYVSIDGLKLRRAPSVDSPFITTLPLFDELTFLNEVSDSTDIISLGEGITANEPWVKVRHYKGNEGWVYGAGVHYYKMKYPGL